MLGVVTQSLCEITILAQKAGVPRHAFLDFLNKSVMGSMFTRYKTPALCNLDFHVTFTPELLRKDIDLGLAAGRQFGVPMPTTAIARDLVQTLIGHGYDQDFSQLLLLQAKASGIDAGVLSQKLGEFWNQSVVAENRPGAGSSIAAAAVAKAAPDGYVLLFNSSAQSINPALYANLPYSNKDFVDIAAVAAQPN